MKPTGTADRPQPTCTIQIAECVGIRVDYISAQLKIPSCKPRRHVTKRSYIVTIRRTVQWKKS